MKTPSFEELQQMDDASLGEVLGHNNQLERFRSGLADIAKLSGEARRDAEEEIQQMLQPYFSASEPSWIAENAQRKHKSGDEEMQDDSPGSVI